MEIKKKKERRKKKKLNCKGLGLSFVALFLIQDLPWGLNLTEANIMMYKSKVGGFLASGERQEQIKEESKEERNQLEE